MPAVRYSKAERADYDLLDNKGRSGYDDLRQEGNDIGHEEAFFRASINFEFKPAMVVEADVRIRLCKSFPRGEWGSIENLRDLADDQEALAKVIAFYAHSEQRDKNGSSYLGHLARVVSWLRTAGFGKKVRAAAWLHDVIEDTGWTAEDLLAAGVKRSIVRAVVLLTKVKGKSNSAYYVEVAADTIAYSVKRFGDVPDNCDPRRLAMLDPETSARLTAKYAKAIAELDAARAAVQA